MRATPYFIEEFGSGRAIGIKTERRQASPNLGFLWNHPQKRPVNASCLVNFQ
jgi:hypothetical protein